jgi:uncharacterized membrane protein YbhN (UPF0104 family)
LKRSRRAAARGAGTLEDVLARGAENGLVGDAAVATPCPPGRDRQTARPVLAVIYARRNSLLASGQVHIVGWLIGTAEVWIALRFMGLPATINEALVIESLMQAVRGAAFAIPGAFGAQEAGLILLCGIFQIPPDQALALSLIKRAADLVVGVPGLVSLQVLEGGRLKARYSHAKESCAHNRS